ncbi:OmpA family protein [Bdellovibrio sp. SKB1291214]|uniref:OmpA family protein n=1 Tax=Bdellovibrio sp. SKB1291214 TaxID=1732569 RepID=UPI000B519564|nr:OmpA family protein [Bdellovibrio sp. SKB1291214]UYL07478.1 OmpA family protein [Bdellovibrio sp. SKB1291214]
MKRMVLIGTAVAMIATGCATANENPNAAKGAGIGAAIGAVAGAVIGHQTGKRNEGALIGAALGAGIGGGVGHRMDQQAKELAKIAETKRTEQGLITKLKSDILFDTGKSTLKPAAQSNISELAQIMKKYPENILTVRGYTDDTGTAVKNNPLSKDRAEAVRAQLIASGVPANTITSIGMGATNPVDPAKTAEARSKNRRVEIEITVDESKVPKQANAH